ncbi:unnamed protein product [Trifolium pratense]|uniref:Uncharacterized protein n=1 Tax=Trifolium pratense TaxID=57577 RepID=A0ACB0L2H2_TRIPR|nr:unnamed protein product [Trifolium pratense]
MAQLFISSIGAIHYQQNLFGAPGDSSSWTMGKHTCLEGTRLRHKVNIKGRIEIFGYCKLNLKEDKVNSFNSSLHVSIGAANSSSYTVKELSCENKELVMGYGE